MKNFIEVWEPAPVAGDRMKRTWIPVSAIQELGTTPIRTTTGILHFVYVTLPNESRRFVQTEELETQEEAEDAAERLAAEFNGELQTITKKGTK